MSGSFHPLAQQDHEESYGELLIGTVVSNSDPEFKQRIKVTVPSVLEGPVESLPWIEPLVRSEFGITNTAVTIAVPAVGSTVAIELQGGDILYGISHGDIHTINTLVPPELKQNYPNRRGWKDPAGNLFYIDRTPGSERIYLKHVSGTEVVIEPNGQVRIVSVEKIVMEAATEIHLTSPLTTIDTTDLVINSVNTNINATTTSLVSPSTSIVGNTSIAGNTLLQGPTTSILGPLTNNGQDIGDTHFHNVPNVDTGPSTVPSTPPV